MAYLDQTSPDQQDDRIVEEILRDGFAGLLKIENEINRIYENMATISDIEECNRMANRVSMLQQNFRMTEDMKLIRKSIWYVAVY